MTGNPQSPSALNVRRWVYTILGLSVLTTAGFYAVLFFAPGLHPLLFFIGSVPVVLALTFVWVGVKVRTKGALHRTPMRVFTFTLLGLQLLTMFVRLYYEPAETETDIRNAVMMLFCGLTAGVGAAIVLRSERR
jgi:hypothetical protein